MVREYLKLGLIAIKNPKESCIWISGNTFENKQILREMNGVWDSQKKMWRLPGTTNLRSLQLSKAAALRAQQMEVEHDLYRLEMNDDRSWRRYTGLEFNHW